MMPLLRGNYALRGTGVMEQVRDRMPGQQLRRKITIPVGPLVVGHPLSASGVEIAEITLS
jgi:hypothetical protein